MNQLIKIYLLAFLGIWGLSCVSTTQPTDDHAGQLFKKLTPEYTGIDFSNDLTESDTFNILFYEFFYNGSGVAIGDVNNDGLSDIFFGGNMGPSKLYLNQGDLHFQDYTLQAGIHTQHKWVTGVSMVDLNADGWLDIYLCVGGNIADDYSNLFYLNNADASDLGFKEESSVMNIDDDGYSTQAAFFDYDKDDDLDMYLVTSAMNIPNKNSIRKRRPETYMSNADRFYRNDGINPVSGLPIFTNISTSAGITGNGFGLGICISDINLDGWPDVYVANDYISNDLLYINQQDGTFSEQVDSFFRHLSYSAMGVDIADFNNDGLVDLCAVDMLPPDHYRKRIMAGNGRSYTRYQLEKQDGYSDQYIRNTLQINNGQQSFSEIGQLLGIHETDWSWAPLFADFDNDGLRDLFIGNGIPHDITNMDFVSYRASKVGAGESSESFKAQWKELMAALESYGNVKLPNYIYKNLDGLAFEDNTVNWGLADPSHSTCPAFADLDNDGDLDLVINNINDPASVYKNHLIETRGKDGDCRYLLINLLGAGPNKGGIGTKIHLHYEGQRQFYEHFPVRGFQSMVDPKIHFGLGSIDDIDTVHVHWPDGKHHYLYDVPVDTLLQIQYPEVAMPYIVESDAKASQDFIEVTQTLGIDYHHLERPFNDFNIQPLVPHQYSKEGPGIAVADINGDHLDDFFVGGSTSYGGKLYIQKESGRFTSYYLGDNPNYEDMGALFFDADGDSDQDLYVVSGGTGLPPGNPFYGDRLYLNDGQGNFSKAEHILPDIRVCGSQVTACDFDKDGDLDVFVSGRVDLEHYPKAPQSYLLRNESSNDTLLFTDITEQVGGDLRSIGLLSAALWSDFDRDGWIDLILCGEWMPVTFFRNQQGTFSNVTATTGLEAYTGWWNSISAADFDRDGDVDYVVGNLGLNTRFKVSQEEPMSLYALDFDENGTVDPVCTHFVAGRSYPIYSRDLLLTQLPYLKKKLNLYADYASSTMEDIFSSEVLDRARVAHSSFFQTAYIEHLSDGHFKIRALPRLAQISPTFGLLCDDFDKDGYQDILLAGNSYSSDVETGHYDASTGLLLRGDGNGQFEPQLARESGFMAAGDCKGMAQLISSEGQSVVLTAQNSGRLLAHRALKRSEMVRLNNDDAFAEIIFRSGARERREFSYGHGFLSHSSRVLQVPYGAQSIQITSYRGETRNIKMVE